MFTAAEAAELYTAIAERSMIPTKFAYFGEGAERWAAIAAHGAGAEAKTGSLEAQLLRQHSADFFGHLNTKKVDVVDIGAGDGSPAVAVLDELVQRKVGFSYFPVDTSAELLSAASDLVAQRYGCPVRPCKFDVESKAPFVLPALGAYPRMTLLLGTTLGNFHEPAKVLGNVTRDPLSGDCLIVGSRVSNTPMDVEMLRKYNNPLIRSFVYTVPKAIGLREEQLSLDVQWNNTFRRTELYVVLNETQTATIGDQTLTLDAGTRLLAVHAQRHTAESLTQLLGVADLDTDILRVSDDGGYLVALARKSQHKAL